MKRLSAIMFLAMTICFVYGPTLSLAETAMEAETPLDLMSVPSEVAGIKVRGFFVGSYSYNSHIQMVPEFAGGSPALSDAGKSNFRYDKFGLALSKTFAPWLYASATFEVESHRDRHAHGYTQPVGAPTSGFGCFSPGSIPCTERFGAEAAETVTNLDRFSLTVVAPVGNGLVLSLGRFDIPFGIERHDEPLLLTATTSDIFRYGRPNFMTGFRGVYQFNPAVDLDLFVVNRWESETTHDDFNDNNGAKSYGGRIGFTPLTTSSLLNFGVGGFYGAEQDETASPKRWVLDADVTWTPISELLLAGEFVYGGEDMVSLRERGIPYPTPAITDQEINWWAFNLLAHYDAYDWLGLSLRYGYFADQDGARTGVPQNLQNITFAPIVHLSRLIPDLRPTGATYARTRHMLDWVDLKMEYRHNFSNKAVFSEATPAVDVLQASKSSDQILLQVVVNF